jgi:DedD protein
MEKEQKKLLLVAVSVGMFLLVTITTAMVILTPKMQTQGNTSYPSVPYRAGNVQDNGNNSLQPANSNFQETNTSIVSENPAATGNDGLIVQIPRPTTAAVPDSPEKPASAITNSAAAKPAASKTVASPNPSTSKPSSGKTINDYWIQTGAYSALVRAEDVKERLASNGLTSIIENRVIEGTLYYRVRLGPYTSEREANYWLTLVKSIDGFGESQVRQTARQL